MKQQKDETNAHLYNFKKDWDGALWYNGYRWMAIKFEIRKWEKETFISKNK
jgi:hypothetical protein